MKWLDKLIGKKDKPEPKAKKTKLSPKDQASKNKEPWIDILSVEIDDENPNFGSFELDWNDYFIINLRQKGYPGKTDEDCVDNWFRDVCRNVVMETYQNESDLTDNIKYINRKNIGNGRSVVS
jgi:hypothetical protein